MDRSKAAPMDWKYDSPSRERPGWAKGDDSTRKRQHMEVDSAPPAFPSSRPVQPMFGANQNTPFMFHTPSVTRDVPMEPWVPPPNLSPKKMFPELRDIEMDDAAVAAAAAAGEGNGERAVAPGAMQRVFRTRQRLKSKNNRVRDDEDDSGESDDEDEGGRVARVNKSTSNHYTLNMPSVPAPPRDLPYLLSGFLQIIFNAAILAGILFILFQFLVTMRNDVNQRLTEYSMGKSSFSLSPSSPFCHPLIAILCRQLDIVQDIAMCASHYRNNLCDTPLPAMAHQCADWKTCMNRNPNIIGRLRVWAEVFAEVFNAFVEPISWKALAFTLTTFGFSTVFINVVLSLYRARHHPAPPTGPPAMPPYGHQQPHPNWIAANAAWTPPSRDEEIPTRRRRLEDGRAAKIK